MTETILTNARIVCPDSEFDGSLVIEDGCIADILSCHLASGIALDGVLALRDPPQQVLHGRDIADCRARRHP